MRREGVGLFLLSGVLHPRVRSGEKRETEHAHMPTLELELPHTSPTPLPAQHLRSRLYCRTGGFSHWTSCS